MQFDYKQANAAEGKSARSHHEKPSALLLCPRQAAAEQAARSQGKHSALDFALALSGEGRKFKKQIPHFSIHFGFPPPPAPWLPGPQAAVQLLLSSLPQPQPSEPPGTRDVGWESRGLSGCARAPRNQPLAQKRWLWKAKASNTDRGKSEQDETQTKASKHGLRGRSRIQPQ